MLSAEQNELITRTNRGTACGDLVRRYWQPVALAEEFKSEEPLAVAVLGEELVLFRDAEGQLGLIQRRCPHRGADLSYGRVEDDGLRCIYHGWLFATNGKCLEQPGEPAASSLKERAARRSYPCRQAGSLIMAYLGEGDPPPLPGFPFLASPDDERVWCTKVYQHCNYLQANEGNVDPQHLSFLHRFFADESAIMPGVNKQVAADVAPQLHVKPTPFGLEIMAVRNLANGDRYIRLTNFIMPNCSTFEGVPLVDSTQEENRSNQGYQVHWHVPIDDYSHWKYTIIFRYTGKMDRAYQKRQPANIDEHYRTPAEASNRFLQNREEMKSKTYAGLGQKYYDHDKFATESQGPISDRTVEHLGGTDRAIVMMRHQMFQAIAQVQEDKNPLMLQPGNPLADMIVWSGTVDATVELPGTWRPKAEKPANSPALDQV